MFPLSTEKIRLRALEPEDVAQLYNWENDPNIWLISNTMSPYSKFILMELVNASTQDIYTAKQLRLIIESNQSRQAAGVLDIFEFDAYHARAGIGIFVDRTYRRQGFAEDAIRLCTRYLFEHLHLHQIYCHVMSRNLPAISLFKKTGFSDTGCKKDWIRTSEGYGDAIFMQLINTAT